MKTYVIGAGGVGGYYCGLLARGGADVSLVCSPGKSALYDQGLTVTDRGNKFHVSNFKTIDSISGISEPELIILAVKTYHLDGIAAQLAAVVSERTVIITLQNGMGSDLQITERLSPEVSVFPGLTWVISKMVTPGNVEQKSPRTFIKFGSRRHGTRDQLMKVNSFLNSNGIEAQISDDIIRDIWEKYIWLVNFAGIAGTKRADVGSIVNDPEGFELWVNALDETLAVADALNISRDPNLREIIINKLENYKTVNSDFKPSLLVDIENGRQTEIEALSGKLITLAKQLGIKVPVHEMFYSAITGKS